jgi:DNA-directed RNA polymerase III subunit RPC5
MGDIEMDNDPDPIKASYDVYIKPRISSDKEIYVLQFPNRDAKQHYSAANMSQPFKMRIKPNSRMVEMDVPMDALRNYDREKGIKWGEAMKKSNMAKNGGSHGMPGGFGIGGAQPSGRGRGRGQNIDEELNQQRILEDYENAVKREQVLVKQTLGGQCISNEDSTPQYMIGTFRKSRLFQTFLRALLIDSDQLHLTPVDNIVQMRPQFHHIDAHTEQERFGRVRDPAMATRVPEARAIHMTVKSNVDGEEETTDTMAERIAAAQSEAWKTQRYVDEDDVEAWAAYEKHLFVGAAAGLENNEDLQANMPQLKSALDDAEYLDTISAPRDAAKLSRSKKVGKKRNNKGKGKENAAEGAESDSSSTISDSASDSGSDEDDAP